MRFTVTNTDPVKSEKLLSLSTAAAKTAQITAPIEIPPQSTISYGEPNVQAAGSNPRLAPVRLADLAADLRPGTTTQVTFRFQRSGDITMPVPVEACPRQDDAVVPADEGGPN